MESYSEDPERQGIISRSFDYIFRKIEEIKAEAENDHNNVEFLVKSSYLEIYNE
jgi:hypothetical protein